MFLIAFCFKSGNIGARSLGIDVRSLLHLFSGYRDFTHRSLGICWKATLAVYVTDSGCAGTVATSYGFKVDSLGVGNTTFNIGSNGAAFGVANNSVLSIIDILSRTDAMSAGGTGATQYDIYNGNTVLQNMAINVYDAINNAGHITA